MKRFLHLVVSIVSLLSSVAALRAEDLSPSSIAKLEQLATDLIEQQGIPGMSIAVAQHNELVYDAGFGLADVEHDVPVTNETRFRTASIAKPMTAAVILSLMEAGKIDLDAEVQEYCKNYPQKQWPISVRQLLAHQGGVRHYKSSSEALSTEHFFSLNSALRTFADDPLIHKPGTKYLYSSFGFNLLGSIAEGAGQGSFMQLLQDEVLTPAGMTFTVQDDQLAIIRGRVSGYMRPTTSELARLGTEHGLSAGQLYNAPLHDTSMKVPGGGLLSTASDLVRFATAMNSGKLLSHETRDLMWTRQKTSDGDTTEYGLGWRVGSRSGRKVVWHTGGQSGTSTIVFLVPETGTCVAIMCNLQHAKLFGLATAITDEVLPSKVSIDYSDAIKRLKSVIEYEVEQKQLPAFSISLVDNDRNVWADGFGFQDSGRSLPATKDTVYRVGSVSKLFTDIALLQLVEDGKLDLDVPVNQYLPEFQPNNPYEESITLRQLLSHRSGLVRESPVGNYFDPDEPTLAETVASLNNTSLVYKPGTKTKYSNAAIAVVGAVLEKQLDISHPQRVRRTILDPLGMQASGFVVTPALEPALATGWMRTYDGRRFQAPTFLLGTGPAGNLYSSVVDLSKFLACLFNDGKTGSKQIISPAMLKRMATPVKDAEGKTQGFGLGFQVQDFDGTTKIGHGGAVYGFSTQLEALPERKLGVAAAAALDGSNGVVKRISAYALRLMLAAQEGKPLPDYQQTAPVPKARALELVGEFRKVDGDGLARISELSGKLFMQLGTFRYELRADAADGTLITDDAKGFGTTVELETSDRLLVGGVAYHRIPLKPPADIPHRWRGLIGEYGWDHNTLYILEDDGKLYALIEWFYYYPLNEISDNIFEFPSAGLYHGEQLKFTRDSNGTATEVDAAEVKFVRREVGTQDGETFKIEPVKPIDDLRAEALAAAPPLESGEYREANLVDLAALDPTIQLDIRYATENNFTGAVFYQQARAFMQRPAAEAVVRANARLKPHGLGLLIHDAYRPWHVTKMFWDATPESMKDFVANPANGSRHNRGCAVDLTLYDLTTGKPIQMVAGYDEFSPRSFPDYPGGTASQRWHRHLLRRTMESEGFSVYEFEWWHFDFKDWQKYRIGNAPFEQISPR